MEENGGKDEEEDEKERVGFTGGGEMARLGR